MLDEITQQIDSKFKVLTFIQLILLFFPHTISSNTFKVINLLFMNIHSVYFNYCAYADDISISNLKHMVLNFKVIVINNSFTN